MALRFYNMPGKEAAILSWAREPEGVESAGDQPAGLPGICFLNTANNNSAIACVRTMNKSKYVNE